MRVASVLAFPACLAVMALASGCGSSTMAVDAITPSLTLQPDARATTRGLKVAIEEFTTTRDKNKKTLVIGEAKTGFFNFPTDIVASESPEHLVASALREGLTQTGCQIVDLKDADFALGGQVQDFWVSEYATGVSLEYAKAYVRYDLTIKRAEGNTVWGNTLERYETSGQCWDATAEDIPTLTRALQHTVMSVLQDDAFWNALSK